MPDLLTVIQPDGSRSRLKLATPPTLTTYYIWLDCEEIEVVPCVTDPSLEMIIDAQGKAGFTSRTEDRPTNPDACTCAGRPTEGPHRIVGPVIIQEKGTLR